MSAAAQQLLSDFDALPDSDRGDLLLELLRRPMGMDRWPDDGLESAAEELFLAYDDDEAIDDTPTR